MAPGNDMRSLPAQLTLRMPCARLGTADKSFKCFHCMQSLDLGGLSYAAPLAAVVQAVTHLTRLTSLELSWYRDFIAPDGTYFPEALWGLTALRTLRLHGGLHSLVPGEGAEFMMVYDAVSMPDEISRLARLTQLLLCDCQVRSAIGCRAVCDSFSHGCPLVVFRRLPLIGCAYQH